MALIPIFELGVADAYALLARHFRKADLPPLNAIENEDWGRDYLLSQFQEFSTEQLAAVGLTLTSHPASSSAREGFEPGPGVDGAQ